MAVTVASLAVELRLAADATETIPDGQEAILTRLLASANAIIDQHVTDRSAVPDALEDQAVIELAAYLYDRPGAARGAGWSNVWRNSGASVTLANHVTRRGVHI